MAGPKLNRSVWLIATIPLFGLLGLGTIRAPATSDPDVPNHDPAPAVVMERATGSSESAAAAAAPQGCGSAARVASDLWREFDKRTKQAGCYVPWKGKHRYAPCLLELYKVGAKLTDDMIGFWNSMARGGWATIGPRQLRPGVQRGTLVSTGGRLFVGTVPTNTGRLTVRLKKRGGRAKTEVAVWATHPDGRTERLWHFIVAPGGGNRGRTFSREFRDVEDVIVSVKLDAKSVTRKFEYALEVESEPRHYDLGPVRGFADLHLHQMAHLAHAGLWFWGKHEGRLHTCHPSQHAIRASIPGQLEEIRHGTPRPGRPGSWPMWDDLAHQQVHIDWLKQAHERGLDLAIVSAVNFEPFCRGLRALYPNKNPNWGCRDMENVERQLRAAIRLDQRHDWYEIAVDPWHARKIIHEGKLAVVLSMEVSHLLPPSEGDFVAQLDRLRGLGLRTLQLAHETDSRFAGAAPHRSIFRLLNSIKHPLLGIQLKGFDLDARGKNKRGLTQPGHRLVAAMTARHMPIEFAHLSERAVRDVYSMAERRSYYPLYNSHTRFRPLLNAADLEEQGEFLSTCEQVTYIERTGGIVGLRTGDNDLKPIVSGVVANSCPGSSRSLAQMVAFGNRRSGVAMGFGSDLNGFISQVGPRFGSSACHQLADDAARADAQAAQQRPPDPSAGSTVASKSSSKILRGRSTAPLAKSGPTNGGVSETFNIKGLSHVGLLPDLLNDLDAVGADTRRLRSSAEAFLRMWERAYDDGRGPLPVRTNCAIWPSGSSLDLRKLPGKRPQKG